MFAWRKLNLLVLRGGVLDRRTTRELDTLAFQFFAVRNGAHRGGVLVQEVDLLEGQSLSLKYHQLLNHRQGVQIN